jgi:hypothetical protein
LFNKGTKSLPKRQINLEPITNNLNHQTEFEPQKRNKQRYFNQASHQTNFKTKTKLLKATVKISPTDPNN